MKLEFPSLLFLISTTPNASVDAFAPTTTTVKKHDATFYLEAAKEVIAEADKDKHKHKSTRQEFLSSASRLASAGIVSTATLVVPLGQQQWAQARGRATLEFSYDRYTPRLLAGGQFFATDLRQAIAKNDWAAIKAATSEPPKRSKEDKSKIDGGTAERAAQAGGFSDARVLTAADLWAASFSDNSISPKTKKMKEQVEILREVVNGMNTAAKVALGEEKAGGGFFGMGSKKPSQAELANEVRDLYMKGGNAWNQYIYEANDALPITLTKLPYL